MGACGAWGREGGVAGTLRPAVGVEVLLWRTGTPQFPLLSSPPLSPLSLNNAPSTPSSLAPPLKPKAGIYGVRRGGDGDVGVLRA